MDLPQKRAQFAYSFLNVTWYFVFALALFVLAASLPGYAQRVFVLGLEPIDAPDVFVVTTRALGALASIGTAGLSLALAALLFARKRAERMALLLSFYLIGYGVAMGGPLESLRWLDARWFDIGLRLQATLMLTPTLLLLAWFPNGKWFPRWMRYPVLASLLFIPFTFFVSPGEWFRSASVEVAFANVVLVALILLGIGAQVYRYRRVSTPPERQQTKWFVLGWVVWLGLFVLVTIPYVILSGYPPGALKPWWAPLSELIWWLTLMVIPLTLTLAIMRYRLWDVDLILNRALVYGAMTALIVALYILIVGSLSAVFNATVDWLASLMATGIVAVLFQPLRARVQRGVNRFVYGERDDPYAALQKLGQRLEATLEADAVLPAIVETVAQAMKLPYAAIELATKDGGRQTAARFPATDVVRHASVLALPLAYQREMLGELVVAPRVGQETFSDADKKLLNDLARQAGVAVHAARLTMDLQISRERLVTEREQERRRLRRDLHDGLGPALATLTLKLDAARNLVVRDPERTEQLLRELKRDTQGALADIRRLVYELRPPALDELGLVGALREQAMQYSGANDLQITIVAPDALPPLSAAVEVAAYRIATEALTNVVQHAHASRCCVTLAANGVLQLVIQDNGVGMDDAARAGVGLTSMGERAHELGGTFALERAEGGGARVRATLPLAKNEG